MEFEKDVQLSKSEYMMFLKHPAWLWLKKHDKNKLPAPDDNLQATFDAGVEFEDYAQKRFPKGIRLGFNNYNEYLSLPKRTTEVWEKGIQTIFQGRFEQGNITCICDIVDRAPNDEIDLYEVKSSTKVKPEHYLDLAFQVLVLESCGYVVRNIAVIHVNGKYVRNGKVDPLALSAVTDITIKVREKIPETEKNIDDALKVISSPEMPDPSPRYTNLGALGEWMDIYKNLGNKIDTYSIYNIIALGAEDIGELEDLEIALIKDIPENFKLTTKQQVQVMATKRGERSIAKAKIKDFLECLTYPIYFLDYETSMSIVPPYDGTSPYQQIPFQYSLHILDKPVGELKHTEYLHRDSTHPVPKLLEKLKKDIGSTGSILVWYKTFEMKRNLEMVEMFPEYKNFLIDVNSRVVDLMEPFAQGLFVDKDFFGSSSIKNVLPVMVPNLNYKGLDIQEGQSAQRLWMEAVIKNKEGINKAKLFHNLIEYCKLDTLAMVEIWRVLNNL